MTSQRFRIKVKASPKQTEFLTSRSKFNGFIGGVGSGKTFAGALKALSMPAGSQGMVVAPTYKMLEDASITTFMDIARPMVAEYNRQHRVAELVDGKRILFRSADGPETLRGPNLGWFWLDEAALMPELAWDVMLGRLRLQPAQGWVTTTPRGFNWLYRAFSKGGENYRLFNSSTRENTFLPEGYVKSLEEKYSSAFAKQEIEGEFCEQGGTRVSRAWLKYGDPPAGLDIVLAADLAISTKAEADYTAVAVVGRERTGNGYRWWVLDVQRERVAFQGALRFIEAMAAKWNPSQVVVEEVQYQAAAVQELLRTTSLPVRGVKPDKDKLTRFQPLEARYEQGLVWHAPGLPRDFEDELLSFPVGAHDDMVDALAYAYRATSATGAAVVSWL